MIRQFGFAHAMGVVLLTLGLGPSRARAQNYERIVLDKSDNLYGSYLAVPPESKAIRGVLVLLPGWRSSAESVMPETRLPGVAFSNDILTIVVNTGSALYIDDRTLKSYNGIFSDVLKRYRVPPNKFVIGGHSAGGTLSLRYVEMCRQRQSSCPIAPQAVFTVDSPVDLVNLYESFEHEIRNNFSPPGVQEAVQIKAQMDSAIGPLKTSRQKYIELSPFRVQQATPGNEQFLRNIPVRTYHDIDVQWMIENKHRSLFDTNALAASDLVAALRIQGNAAAEFRTGWTGYRNDGTRHPHTWAIVDEVEMLQWVKRVLKSG